MLSRLCKSLPALSPDELTLSVEAWAQALMFAKVPLGKLERYYLIALQSRESTFPLGVDEIIAVWQANQYPSFMSPPK